MKKILAILFGVILVLVVGVLFFQKEEKKVRFPWQSKEEEPTPTPGASEISFEESQRLAEEAVKNAPTYKFDGFDLKFEGSETLRCPSCWEFTFSFKSRAAGYGDRSGKMVAQIITPHTTRATVDKGKITSVVTDRTFDELNQKFLK